MVKILRGQKDIQGNKPENYSQIPMGSPECDGATPHQPHNRGQTPLSWPVGNGHDRVVKILQGQDINTDKPDNNTQTLLGWTADNEHTVKLKIQLRQNDVSPTNLKTTAKHPSGGLLVSDIRE